MKLKVLLGKRFGKVKMEFKDFKHAGVNYHQSEDNKRRFSASFASAARRKRAAVTGGSLLGLQHRHLSEGGVAGGGGCGREMGGGTAGAMALPGDGPYRGPDVATAASASVPTAQPIVVTRSTDFQLGSDEITDILGDENDFGVVQVRRFAVCLFACLFPN